MDTLRIGDAERAEAVGLLGDQYSEGRLTKDEFDERSDAVWSARTRGDLVPLFADLPVRSSSMAPAGTAGAVTPATRAWRRPPFPLAPVLFVLIALTVLTHLPIVLVGLLIWFVLSRRFGIATPSWSRRRTSRH